MSISEGYFMDIQNVYAGVKESFVRLNKLQSALDRKLSDCYHDLERFELSEIEGRRFLEDMQKTVRDRRVVKDELAKLHPIYDILQEQFQRIENRYNGAVKKSYEIRESLRCTGSLDDVLAKYPAEIEYR